MVCGADISGMAQGALLNTYVFLFMFAFGFLIAGKRPILTLSTRALLIVLFGGVLAYALTESHPWHPLIGVATAILNCVFIGFAAYDYIAWRRNKQSGEIR
jgi:hypothetical protein